MGKRFEHLVDQFTATVKAAPIGASTDVILVFHWADEQGRDVSTARESVVPKIGVSGLGVGDPAQKFARSLLVKTILDNIQRRILDAPDGAILLKGSPSPLVLRDIGLEIIQP